MRAFTRLLSARSPLPCHGALVVVVTVLALAGGAGAAVKSLKIDADGRIHLNDQPADQFTKLWGFRAASAATKDAGTAQLIASLDELKGYNINTLLVCYQGGPGMTLRTFSPEGTGFDDAAARDRVRKIIDAADQKDMLVVVSLFFPRKMGAGGQDPRLASREAYLAAVKTAAAELKGRKNVLLAVLDQPLPSAFSMAPMKFNAADVIDCLKAAAEVAPELPRGGGNASHELNLAVAKSDAATVIFHAQTGTNPPSFPVKKPIIHVGYAGTIESAGKSPQGFYHPAARQPFSDLLDRYVEGSTAHVILHAPAWTEGALDLKQNRFDVGGQGTQKDPGLMWLFDGVRQRTRKRANPGDPPVRPGKSIFD